MDEIHEYIDNWGSYFVKRNEYDIEQISDSVIEALKAYFKHVSGSDEIYRKIDDLLLLRQRERENRRNKQIAKESKGDPAQEKLHH